MEGGRGHRDSAGLRDDGGTPPDPSTGFPGTGPESLPPPMRPLPAPPRSTSGCRSHRSRRGPRGGTGGEQWPGSLPSASPGVRPLLPGRAPRLHHRGPAGHSGGIRWPHAPTCHPGAPREGYRASSAERRITPPFFCWKAGTSGSWRWRRRRSRSVEHLWGSRLECRAFLRASPVPR